MEIKWTPSEAQSQLELTLAQFSPSLYFLFLCVNYYPGGGWWVGWCLEEMEILLNVVLKYVVVEVEVELDNILGEGDKDPRPMLIVFI